MLRTPDVAAAAVPALLLRSPTTFAAAHRMRTLQLTFPGGDAGTLSVPARAPLSAIRVPHIRPPIPSTGDAGPPAHAPTATASLAPDPQPAPEVDAPEVSGDSVLLRARLIAGAPADLVGSLTGPTQGPFPVVGHTTYPRGGGATNIFSWEGAAVVAVQDAEVVRPAARSVAIRDVFGYTYAGLARLTWTYELPASTGAPATASLAGRRQGTPLRPSVTSGPMAAARSALHLERAAVPVTKERLPSRPPRAARMAAASRERRLRVGSRVAGGTVLGRLGHVNPGTAPFVKFRIRPVGKGTPSIDPKPIRDGWKLLARIAIFRARGRNPLLSTDARGPRVGQILLATKALLAPRVLATNRSLR